MIKVALALVVLVGLSGCDQQDYQRNKHVIFTADSNSNRGPGRSRDLSLVCVEGVQYYHRALGDAIWFAPVVDRNTLQFKNCEN